MSSRTDPPGFHLDPWKKLGNPHQSFPRRPLYEDDVARLLREWAADVAYWIQLRLPPLEPLDGGTEYEIDLVKMVQEELRHHQ
jgi:hypothetical protein